MKQKDKNILALLLSAALSCIMIPEGLSAGWTAIQIIVSMSFVLAAGVILTWNNRKLSIPLDDNDGKMLGLHLPATLMCVFGTMMLMMRSFDRFWLNCIGGAVLVAGAVLERSVIISGGVTR